MAGDLPNFDERYYIRDKIIHYVVEHSDCIVNTSIKELSPLMLLTLILLFRSILAINKNQTLVMILIFILKVIL